MRTIITPIAFFCFFSLSAQNIVVNPVFGYEGFTYVDGNSTSEIAKIVLTPDGNIISAGTKFITGGVKIAMTKHDAIGTQDLTFGTNGVASASIFNEELVSDLQLQADGKILVAGSTFTGDEAPGGYPVIHAFIMRFHPNGIIDSSFATNGIFTVDEYDQSEFNTIIVHSDQSLRLFSFSDGITYMTKLTTSGALDSSFGTNGSKAISDLSTFYFFHRGAIRLTDGSILSYGMEDTGFSNPKLACIKTDISGDVVTSFGVNGIFTLDIDTDPVSLEMVFKAKELANGKIVMAGETNSRILTRLNADGTLDSTFAINGVLTHTLPCSDMVVQPNGKILVGGSHEVSQFNWGITVSRFDVNGALDESFNTTGTFDCDFSTGFESMRSMVLTSPDHLLMGGKTDFITNSPSFLLTEIDMSQSLSVQNNPSDNVSLYPNPVSDELTISIPDESITGIQLTDASGRVISTHAAGKNTVLSLTTLPAGMYQVVFTNNQQERFSKKLIKQ